MTGLSSLAGVVVNRVGIYGSKVAEGLSAFQRRSCFTLAGSSTIFLGYFFSSTNSKAIFWGTKTTNFYKNRSFWPQIQFFPRSFWVQFSAASGTPPSVFRPSTPPGGILYFAFYSRWWSSLKVNNTEFSDMSSNRSPADNDINTSIVCKFDHEIIWRFGVKRIQDQASAYNKFCIIWSAILRRLPKCYLIHYKEPWHLTNDHCRRYGGNDWHSEWRVPEPMLTYRQWGPVTITREEYHKRYLSYESLKLYWKLLI